MKAAIFLILLPLCAKAEIIRLSLVSPEAIPGYTRFEYSDGEEKNVVFVEDKGFLSDADIAFATSSPQREDAVDVTLSPEGTEKMIAATTPMRPAIDRIAIMVDGKILSAPVVQSVPLGKNFVINGLTGKDEPARLAARLMGKTGAEIDRAIAEEKERIKNLPPRPEPVYHTEAEYQQLKEERGKMGLNYMDRIFTEEELNKLLKVGMTEADVIAIFGKPSGISTDENETRQLTFETAPEKRPVAPEYHMDSFVAKFASEKLASWHPFGWSKTPREPKHPPRKPGNLIIKSPPIDMSAEDLDLISFCEKIEISLKPDKKASTPEDIYELLNILWSTAATVGEQKTIDSQCDMIRWLAAKIPELAELAEKPKNEGIPLEALMRAIEPYVFGKKDLR